MPGQTIRKKISTARRVFREEGAVELVRESSRFLKEQLTYRVMHGEMFFSSNFDFRNAIRFNDFRIAYSCDIMPVLPRSTVLPHPTGIVVGNDVEVGENLLIHQNVTIGSDQPSLNQPVIGDDVIIYAGAIIINDVTVGDGAIIGANSVVVDDVPAETIVAGSPAKPVGGGRNPTSTGDVFPHPDRPSMMEESLAM